MLNPFQIKKPVGLSYALDETDVLNTKSALSSLGHYKEPDTGMTPWPDTPMFEGLKTFQKDQGLKVDGLMKPGGPTEKALRSSMQPLGIVEGEWDWQEKTMGWPPKRPRILIDENPAATPEFTVPIQPFSLPLSLKSNINQEHVPASTTKTPQGTPSPQRTPRPDETQVAMAPAAALPWLLGTGTAVITGEFLRRQIEDLMQNNDSALPPLLPAEPEPPLPPSERPDTSMKPNREEFPATPPRTPKMRGNPAARPEPTIEIYPGADDFAKRMGAIVEQRKERVETAEQIDQLLKDALGENRGWKHEAGGRDKTTGQQKKEYYTPGPGHGFPRPGRETGDGRKLSGYTDLTIKSPDGKYFKHYQTVDVDHNGKPTQRELDNAERIRRNLRNKRGEFHHIYLIPKTWQMPK
ncbi:MAG: peptidoglycan-binding protein [Rhodospirillales bacterium]|nr:peptidoglycan-binding protein [Rhodospirillales bacterium]